MNGLQDSLLLSTAWDLAVDASGNIALQSGSAAVAQDVATVVGTYLGECWYDTSAGIPYLGTVLGQAANYALFTALYNAAALTVPNVVSAQTTFSRLSSSRKLAGTVEVIDTYGQSIGATF